MDDDMPSRSIDLKRLMPLLLPLAFSGCAPTPPPSAPPPPPAVMAPAPVLSSDWRDWPITPGAWQYLAGTPISSARYGDSPSAQFIVQCDKATRRVMIMRAGSGTDIAIITSTRTARFPAGHIDDRGKAMTGVILSPTDTVLDELSFSRGRIAVTSAGLPSLAIPAWAEPARAIEDCRK